MSVSVSALHDEAGAVYALLATEREITAQMRAASEIRFRRLADDIPALLRVEDEAGRAELVNRACVEFMGRSREALLGRGWLEFVHAQDRERFVAEHSLARATQRQFEIDVRLQRHDGDYRWMRSVSVPQVCDEGQFSCYIALMLDVEERKRAETGLLTADRRKDEFLAMLAHELRNPLAPIRSAVTILSRSQQIDHRADWAVGVIDRQAQTLAKLLESLLDVARISSGKTVLELAPVEVRALLSRAVEVSQSLIDSRRQRLSVDVAADPSVEGDLIRLTQVFSNLLNNASKYTQEGGEICIEARVHGEQVIVRVSNNGAGLDADMLPRVFDLFAQADQTLDRAGGGLGLGLTLVRQLVELHKGVVQAESPGLGRGSVFTVRLPLLRLPDRVAPTAAFAAHPEGAKARRILIVDDNQEGAAALSEVLEMDGLVIRVAHDGPSGLEHAERERPDVILWRLGTSQTRESRIFLGALGRQHRHCGPCNAETPRHPRSHSNR